MHGLLIVVASCCGAWSLGSRTQFWCMGLVAPCHVGSAWTRDRTCVREGLSGFLLSFFSLISDSLSTMPSFFQTDVFPMAVDKLLLGTGVTSLVFLSEHLFSYRNSSSENLGEGIDLAWDILMLMTWAWLDPTQTA